MKRVLITGSEGFIGKNLLCALRVHEDIMLSTCDLNNKPADLPGLLDQADIIVHLAGVNRPQHEDEFRSGNTALTETIVAHLRDNGKATPVIISSSTQAAFDNPYGLSKRAAEEALFAYGRESGAPVFVYRLPNVFGKWCRPNYNSAVATFCHNMARDLPIQINDPNAVINLVYIDDVVNEFRTVIRGTPILQTNHSGKPAQTAAKSAMSSPEPHPKPFCSVHPVHTVKLGEIVALIESFKESRASRSIPDMSDLFTKQLYSTYLSYLPTDRFSYPLKMNVDNRGSFTEFIKTADRGQVSINISKPGITKGNHWHHTKNEKFLVVGGCGVISFRKIDSDEIINYHVSGETLEVLDIPPGYTHNITNTGAADMVTVMWSNEAFDPDRPDTCFEEV
jgi:UDP-2-acetamido-2,6-beta-L-arabino-hexul-4-ose reductase